MYDIVKRISHIFDVFNHFRNIFNDYGVYISVWELLPICVQTRFNCRNWELKNIFDVLGIGETDSFIATMDYDMSSLSIVWGFNSKVLSIR